MKTSGASRLIQLHKGSTGSLGVTIAPQINARPLAAGNYSDTLRITITPQ
jgi:spore coat protein U-like protein